LHVTLPFFPNYTTKAALGSSQNFSCYVQFTVAVGGNLRRQFTAAFGTESVFKHVLLEIYCGNLLQLFWHRKYFRTRFVGNLLRHRKYFQKITHGLRKGGRMGDGRMGSLITAPSINPVKNQQKYFIFLCAKSKNC